MKIIVTDILWNAEVDGKTISQEELGLPSTVIIDEDIDYSEISDFLSDKYGYCVSSFSPWCEEDNASKKQYIIMYCYERNMRLLGKATTYGEALAIMKNDFFKVFDDQVGTREAFANEEGLNDTWWLAEELGEAWINGNGNHDWLIVDISQEA